MRPSPKLPSAAVRFASVAVTLLPAFTLAACYVAPALRDVAD